MIHETLLVVLLLLTVLLGLGLGALLGEGAVRIAEWWEGGNDNV